MQLINKKIEFNFEYDVLTDGRRTATIIFIKKEKGGDRFRWKFLKCNYFGLSVNYTDTDWIFLGEIAEKIKKLKKKLNE